MGSVRREREEVRDQVGFPRGALHYQARQEREGLQGEGEAGGDHRSADLSGEPFLSRF